MGGDHQTAGQDRAQAGSSGSEMQPDEAARYHQIVMGSPATFFTTDLDLRYTWVVNPPPEFAMEEMLGKRDDELLPAEAATPFMGLKRAVLTHEKAVQQEVDLVLEGTMRRWSISAQPLYGADQNLVGVAAMAVDITAQARAEERLTLLAEVSHLLNNSLDYVDALEAMAQAVAPGLADWCSVDVVNAQGQIEQIAVAHTNPEKVEWARAWRRYHPLALDDPQGVANVIRTGQPEFYAQITRDDLLARADEQEVFLLEELDLRSAIIVPLIARSQTLGALSLVLSDSERYYSDADVEFAQQLAERAAIAVDNVRLLRNAQDTATQLRSLTDTLERRVVERTAELERSNRELDQFTYVASHDLKAPLRAIDHLSAWILEDAGDALPAQSRRHLDKMHGRIRRMQRLLDDLLAYARVGRQQGEYTRVDVVKLVGQIVDMLDPPAGFQIECVGEMPTIETLGVPLEMALRNLINNAVKHHDRDDGRITISMTEGPEMYEFAVADDGPGIDPAFHDRMFQMFQTLRPRDQVEGSGIGLSVVKKIVDTVGGDVRVVSTPGQGATFFFTWPKRLPSHMTGAGEHVSSLDASIDAPGFA